MTISSDDQIRIYIHCALCVEEVKAAAKRDGHASPRDSARLQAGWTPDGIQVWCIRHECNVINIDFQGQKHPAVVTRKPPKGENGVKGPIET